MVQVIPGFHAVLDALSYLGTGVQEVWIAEGKERGRADKIRAKASSLGIPVIIKSKKELSQKFPHIAHQGFVAVAEDFKYAEVASIISKLKDSNQEGLLVAADHISDEGNLASLIRTSAFFGAHGLIIPKDRSAKVSYKVIKRACGTHLLLPICQVTNLGRTLESLDKEGFWIIGTSGKGNVSLYEFDWSRDLVLVVGNEQKGISEGIKKRCHATVAIPSIGGVESLNVGVATGIILSEIVRQRKFGNSSHQREPR